MLQRGGGALRRAPLRLPISGQGSAPCRHCHLQAAAPGPDSGPLPAPRAQRRDFNLSRHRARNTATHEQAATNCYSHPRPAGLHPPLHTGAGSHIPEPTGTRPAQPQVSCWLMQGDTSNGCPQQQGGSD